MTMTTFLRSFLSTSLLLILVVVLLLSTSHLERESSSSSSTIHATTTRNDLVNEQDQSLSSQSQPPSINFLAIGDWGGKWWYPYHTPEQLLTAQGMARVANDINSRFVVALGDNFYNAGVTKWDSKRRFHSTFDTVYNQSSLMTPWYIIGGNHDHYGNITTQIEHTTKQQQQKSPTKINKNRWQFPSLYHAHSFHSDKFHDVTTTSETSPTVSSSAPVPAPSSVSVDLILIDTVDLCGINSVQHEEQEGYFDPLPLQSKSFASNSKSGFNDTPRENQWDWIDHQLSSSTSDYLLVGGHYPVYSVCEHGPTETLVTHLRPLLQKHNAHYLSGHDHCMVHYEEDNVNYILSGMGDGCCYDASNIHNDLNPKKNNSSSNALKWYISSEKQKLYQAQGGFTSFEATPNEMKVKYHDHRGNVIFEADAIKPRKRHLS